MELSRPGTGAGRPASGGWADLDQIRPGTGATRPGTGATRPGTGAARPGTGAARPTFDTLDASRPTSSQPARGAQDPWEGAGGGGGGGLGERPLTGVADWSSPPMTAGARSPLGSARGDGDVSNRPMTGHQFPMDDTDFPAQSRPMTTVSASRPMTKAGAPGADDSPPDSGAWRDRSAPATGQLQWEEPLAGDGAGPSPEPGLFDQMYGRPKTAGSRPVSGSLGSGELRTRPSTSAAQPRPTSDLARPPTGARSEAGRSRPVTGLSGPPRSHSSGSRPLTGVSRPVTAYQSHSAGASRPGSGQLGQDGRAAADNASWEGRPGTSGRPFTGAVGVGTGPPPGSAAGFRPGTQMPGSRAGPMSRMGSGRPITGSLEKIRVMNRPITQQGLSGMKTGGTGRARMVQDKSYFMGILRTKTSELRSEIEKLRRQSDSLNQEQATYTTYDTRVKEMAGELLEHQAQLADYNVLMELVNMDSDRALVDAEYAELGRRNADEAQLVEKLFLGRKQKEADVAELDDQIRAERRLADTLVEAMPAEVAERYWALQERNTQLQASIEQQQQHLDQISSRKLTLDAELAQSPLKQEAAEQYDTLGYLETKKAELLAEKNKRETPEQERERLLNQVKTNNQEMATLERQTAAIRTELQHAQQELEIAENELEDSNSDRNLKYRELRRREQEMQQFLATYDQTKAEEMRGVQAAQTEVVATLEQISRNLSRVKHLPTFTSKDLGELRASLAVKEGETSKSRSTLSDLGVKHQQLVANHEKIEALDEKVRGEMQTLREKMTKMREEMVVLSDLAALKQQNEEKTTRLTVERVDCQNRQEATRTQLQEAELEHKAVKGELDAQDAWIQLGILERRLASIEQNNYSMQEFVASKRAEIDYTPVKSHVMFTIYENNKRLMEEALAGRSTL